MCIDHGSDRVRNLPVLVLDIVLRTALCGHDNGAFLFYWIIFIFLSSVSLSSLDKLNDFSSTNSVAENTFLIWNDYSWKDWFCNGVVSSVYSNHCRRSNIPTMVPSVMEKVKFEILKSRYCHSILRPCLSWSRPSESSYRNLWIGCF